MDSFKALAILAFSAGAHAAALPQLPANLLGLARATSSAAGPPTATAVVGAPIVEPALLGLPAPVLIASSSVPVASSSVPVSSAVVVASSYGVPTAVISSLLSASATLVVPAIIPTDLPLEDDSSLPLPLPLSLFLPAPLGILGSKPPIIDDLPLPFPLSPLPGLPLPDLPLPDLPFTDLDSDILPENLLEIPTGALKDLTSGNPLAKIIKLGTSAFELILSILSKGASLLPLPGSGIIKSLPVGSFPNGSIPITVPIAKRQLALPTPGVGGVTNGLGGLLSGVTQPLSGVAGTAANVVGAIPGVGAVASPLLGAVGGVLGGASPIVSPLAGTAATPVLNAVSSAATGIPSIVGGVAVSSAVVGAATGIPAIGGGSAVSSAVASASPSINPNINALPFQGIPGADPVGAFSISVIATLLSLLKKDPLSLFAPSLPVAALVKRDLPDLHLRDVPELAKRQLNILPSLSSGIPGVGVGGLPLSGVPGISPDLAFLVGSIAKNIAVPGGNGLGSITSNILGVLNGVVPNFLFQLPVVQDCVPTFGVLQLLASINPSKFKDLGTLTSLSALQQAASQISPGDLSFVKSLPLSPDPTNLIQTIMTLADDILSLPGNIINLKATVAVLCMRILGLSLPGV